MHEFYDLEYYNIPLRRSYKLMASLKRVLHESINIFHRNLGETFIPPSEIPNIVNNHSSRTSHDEDDYLTQLSPNQLKYRGHSLYWRVEEYGLK